MNKRILRTEEERVLRSWPQIGQATSCSSASAVVEPGIDGEGETVKDIEAVFTVLTFPDGNAGSSTCVGDLGQDAVVGPRLELAVRHVSSGPSQSKCGVPRKSS